jgi:uncharacterized protein
MHRIIGNNRNSASVIAGLSLGLLVILIAGGCNRIGEKVIEETETSTPNAVTVVPSDTQTPTYAPSPSHTPKPRATASPTITPTSTPTLHPMSILAAKARAYPGSTITIEDKLDAGANYNRYIAWYESDGFKIYGLLTVPFGEKPSSGWPAIVFNHGYIAPEAYKTTERYIAYVDLLARNGYIVYKIDYRGHDRSEGQANGAYSDPGYTTDVLNAIYSLQSFPLANPQQIGMWGHSMGGFLTLRAMVISSEIKAGVIWSGVVGSYPELLCCWHHPAPRVPTLSPDPDYHISWREQWVNLYGSPEGNPGFWMSLSANSYLNDLSGPIQLHYGTGDIEVPVNFSQDLYQQILSVGKPVEYYEYMGDNHNLANYFNLAMQRTIEFFDEYLKSGG